ncbi:MAG: head-tail connector protein [Aurantimonas endophytica]|uniref:head-tail connector protein n=1 Tax=Aurantimonas endophytica TaxID=1522175 RepID=UPI0030011201
MLRSPELIQPPAVAPVGLEDVKRHCRVDHDEDDEIIEEYIAAAVRKLDGYTGSLGRALITQTWRMNAVPDACGRIRMPFDPIQSIQSVKDGDTDIVADRFVLDASVTGPFLVATTGWAWPARAVLTVEFIAGYGDTPPDVPADIRTAIRLDVEMQYDRPDGPRFEALRQQYRDIVRRSRRWNI